MIIKSLLNNLDEQKEFLKSSLSKLVNREKSPNQVIQLCRSQLKLDPSKIGLGIDFNMFQEVSSFKNLKAYFSLLEIENLSRLLIQMQSYNIENMLGFSDFQELVLNNESKSKEKLEKGINLILNYIKELHGLLTKMENKI